MSWSWGLAMGAPTAQILRHQATGPAWSLEAGRTESIPGDRAGSLTKALKPLDFVLYSSLVEEWVG